MAVPQHHHTIIVGGGPAGLSLAIVLGGFHPYFKDGSSFRDRYGRIADYLKGHHGSLLSLDFEGISRSGIAPVDLFRLLHHPSQHFTSTDENCLDFRQVDASDYLLLSRESVGGIWNQVPDNMLTLSPGHWMELAFYPLATYADEHGLAIDVNELIGKSDLIDYYHSIPDRFQQSDRIRTNEDVLGISPHKEGFLIRTRQIQSGLELEYTARNVVLATGQRGTLRRLDVPGEEQPFVTNRYRNPSKYPVSA